MGSEDKNWKTTPDKNISGWKWVGLVGLSAFLSQEITPILIGSPRLWYFLIHYLFYSVWLCLKGSCTTISEINNFSMGIFIRHINQASATKVSAWIAYNERQRLDSVWIKIGSSCIGRYGVPSASIFEALMHISSSVLLFMFDGT